jgi:hypothetical protein
MKLRDLVDVHVTTLHQDPTNLRNSFNSISILVDVKRLNMTSYHSQSQLFQRGLFSATSICTNIEVSWNGSQHLGASEGVKDYMFSNGLRNLPITQSVVMFGQSNENEQLRLLPSTYRYWGDVR